MHSFLLIGQSNMAGRGFLNEAIPVDTSRIYTQRIGRWQPMFRPINPDRPHAGSSLAERFAECYAAKYNVDVGLICCADGGTSMDQWMPGSLLYDHAVANARLAQRTSTLAGILWHQGESDCLDGLHQTYRERLFQMLTQLRKDLNVPDIPILIGGLGDFLANCTARLLNPEKYPFVNEALEQVAKEAEHTAFVPATGLGANPDQLHFSAAALYEFGQRYFDAYEAMPKAQLATTPENDTIRTEIEKL